MDTEVFKSIVIDLDKKIYELNGSAMKGISSMQLSFENGNWSLQLTRDVFYESATTQQIKE